MLVDRVLWGAAFSSLCLFLWRAPESQAAMTLGQTRIIVSDAQQTAQMPVRSDARTPVLLQIWVDEEGEADHPPAMTDIPFVIDPPVVRLEPGQTRSVRILLTKVPHGLPQDRESLYWFNVLEMAAQPEGSDTENRVDVTILSRLKLFYRPGELARVRYRVNQSSDVAPLQFRLARDDDRLWLVTTNPAPIHQTLARLALDGTALDAVMLAPFATARQPVPAPVSNPSPRLTFATIDDDGNLDARDAVLALP